MLADLPFYFRKSYLWILSELLGIWKKILRPEFFLNLKNKVIRNYPTLSTKCRFWGEKFYFFPQKNYLLIMKRKLCFERSLFFWVTEIREITGFRVSFVRKLKNQLYEISSKRRLVFIMQLLLLLSIFSLFTSIWTNKRSLPACWPCFSTCE